MPGSEQEGVAGSYGQADTGCQQQAGTAWFPNLHVSQGFLPVALLGLHQGLAETSNTST